jgi:hypothetical protein
LSYLEQNFFLRFLPPFLKRSNSEPKRNEKVARESSKDDSENCDVGKEQCQSDDNDQSFGNHDDGKRPKFNFLRGQKHKQRILEESSSLQGDIPEEDSSKRYRFSTKHSRLGQKQNKKIEGQAVVPNTILRRERFYFWPPNPQISNTNAIKKVVETGASSVETISSDMDSQSDKELHKTKIQ